jgi:hypothetical protein
MPDHTDLPPPNHAATPQDWNHAFAALPLEAPAADGWRRLQSAWPRPAHVRRWPTWLAAVAALALAAVLPWQLTRVDTDEGSSAPGRVPDTAAPSVAPDRVAAGRVKPSDRTQAASTPVDGPADAMSAAASRTAAATPPATRAVARDTVAAAAAGKRTQPGLRVVTNPPGSLATQATQTRAAQAARPAPDTPADPQLERLYAESAQLEALVSMARDDRVASAAAATLTSAYDAQVAGIDASLRRADIDATQRTALWQQRVDALRQLAGFESTQRVLAAQGERYDAMLVSID